MAKKKWKPAKGKTWTEKLRAEHPSHGTIVVAPKKGGGMHKMVIPRPLDIDGAMRRVRKGCVMTLSRLRAKLAGESGAETACPLCTGIFSRIVAEAAEEGRRGGMKRVTPYWRTVRDDGSMIEKFPGGAKAQAAKLRNEGVALVAGPRVKSLAGRKRPSKRPTG